MSTALYRRYRPETFAEVIGQEHVTAPLTAALRAGRVSHAYLFSGPRGCGKTTSARIFARCLNCEQGPTDTPCGGCPSCVELARGGTGTLDVVEIDAASHNGVDDARELRERAAFAPARDRYKIFILDEAHMVTPQGFNALLKLVEEPPAHVKFVFATTEPEKVIGTIRSRTHHYPFRLVPPEALAAYLNQLCEAENVSIDKGVVPLVVRAGGGSVRDSLSVLDQLMAGAIDGQIEYERAAQLLGYTSAGLLDDAVGAMAGIDGAALFRVVDHVVESGHDPKRFTEDLLQRLRDLVVLAIAGDAGRDAIHGVPEDGLERMAQQATQLGGRRASLSADAVHDALVDMTGATSPRLQLELLCARLILAQSQPAADRAVPAADAPQPSQGRAPASADLPLPKLPRFGKAAEPAPQIREQRPFATPVPAQREADQPIGFESDAVPAQREQPASHAAAVPVPTKRPQPTRKDTSQTPKAGSQSEPAKPAPPCDDADMLRRRWNEVLEVLKGISRVTWTLVQDHAVIGAVSGESVPVLFQIDPLRERFESGPHADNLSEAIFQAVGLRVKIHGASGDERHQRAKAAPSLSPQPEPHDEPQPEPHPEPQPEPHPEPHNVPQPEPKRDEPAPRPRPTRPEDEVPARPEVQQRAPGVPMPGAVRTERPEAHQAPSVPMPGAVRTERPEAHQAPSVPMPGVPFPADHMADSAAQTSAAQPEGQVPDLRSPLAGSREGQAQEFGNGAPEASDDEYGGASADDEIVDDAEAELSGVQLLKAEFGGVVIEEIDEA